MLRREHPGFRILFKNRALGLLSATGLRPSESLALRWSDLNFENGTIRIERGFVDRQIDDPKSIASQGTVEMHNALGAVMQAWRKKTMFGGDQDFVFTSERNSGSQPRLGGMLSVDFVRPAAIRAGVIDASCPHFAAQHAPRIGDVPRGSRNRCADHPADATPVEDRMLQRYLCPKKQGRKAQERSSDA